MSVEFPSAGASFEGQPPVLPVASHGVIGLIAAECTACMICARECPDWCIHIESHKEQIPPLSPGARPRTEHVLDRFAIDYGLCMYCGICIDVCPFAALEWRPESEYSAAELGGLLHEKPQLESWLQVSAEN